MVLLKGKIRDVVAKLGLDQYKKLLDDADSETTNLEEYEKYAKAQAWLTDSSLLMPTASSGGSPVVVMSCHSQNRTLTSWY